MSDAFKALSDPTRREILNLLRNREMSAGEIGEQFNISGASISHHLKELANAGLVQRERRGQNIIYSIDTTVFEEVLTWIFQVSGKVR